MLVYLLRGYRSEYLMKNINDIPVEAFELVQIDDSKFQMQLLDYIKNPNIEVGLFTWLIHEYKTEYIYRREEHTTTLDEINGFVINENGEISSVTGAGYTTQSLLDICDKTSYYFCVRHINGTL